MVESGPAAGVIVSAHLGDILGFGNLAHHVDVGGGAPTSVGAFRELYQEGVVIPPVKMVREGEIVDDVFRLVLAQIRSKRETAGDFRAQFAANNTGPCASCATSSWRTPKAPAGSGAASACAATTASTTTR